jgi:cell wall-associated NlpC family hydrolase
VNAWYADPVRAAALVTEARSWIGTPFRPYCGRKGNGTDCVHLVAACYIATGFLTSFEPPRYRMTGGDLTESQVEAFLHAIGRFAKLPPGEYQTGDTVAIRLGRVSHHVAIVTQPPLIVHSYQKMGAFESTLRDPTWSKRITAVYRPVTP